jgi:hypothetical protein
MRLSGFRYGVRGGRTAPTAIKALRSLSGFDVGASASQASVSFHQVIIDAAATVCSGCYPGR